jgi:iron(III) transport system ATP-binding protein
MITAVDGDDAVVRIAGLTHRVPVRDAQPGAAKLAVRPNAITLSPSMTADWPGRIRSTAYLGDHLEYEVETEAGILFVVDADVDRRLDAGTDVNIGLHNRGVAVITA